MSGRSRPVLDAVGGTSLVPLCRIVPPGSARVLVKLEWENPAGSMKDRMARAVVAAAERDGRLRPGGTVVEYTGGSTGTSLALVCAARGYRLRIVTSDAFSREKLDHMAALGAELHLVPSEGGRVDAFVHGVGTAASLRGVATVLKERRPKVRIVAVEPAESAVLAGGAAGPHKIEGVGIGYTPPLWEPSLVDALEAVPTAEAKAMARRLAREEALFAGTSSGANVIAALREAARLGPDATVVTLMCDSGLKYLSTDVYRRP
ncbi:MAG: cysteine synthase family protein [Krumholzibacteria bacterium]|nr:cysteine synthase family protein [Candidatus Krumholzibacteria bacterium]